MKTGTTRIRRSNLIFNHWKTLSILFLFTNHGLEAQKANTIGTVKKIKIEWVSQLPGNFGFKDSWSYVDGIYRNRCGQLSCDGLCPDETDILKDTNGCIPIRNLKKMYQLIDTSHHSHTMACTARTYEFSGTNFFSCFSKNGTLYGYSLCNVGTHSSLQLTITGDSCLPQIDLNSITPSGQSIYNCTGGSISIDSTFLKLGILKAKFEFTFHNDLKREWVMSWTGLIHSPVIKKEN